MLPIIKSLSSYVYIDMKAVLAQLFRVASLRSSQAFQLLPKERAT
jgi:hypothetical protein